MPKTHVLYHANCNDGFAAATVLWTHFKDHAVYIPCSYGKLLPAIEPYAPIMMVDFSAPRTVLQDLLEHKLTILDHHKTAEAELKGFPGATFDMKECGASLAWKWLHPNLELPLFLTLIRDRDLWLKEFAATDSVACGLESHPNDFATWARFLSDGEALKQLILDGNTIKRARDIRVERVSEAARLQDFKGFKVPVINISELVSDVGDYLCHKFPESPFSVSYCDRKDLRTYSLRSRGDFDVSTVAKQYGGGGHKGAAGFTVPIPEIP